jgi:hypothetical protein
MGREVRSSELLEVPLMLQHYKLVRLYSTTQNGTITLILTFIKFCNFDIWNIIHILRQPLWSSGQSFWLQIQRSWARFPALSDFSEKQWVWNGVHSASWGQLRSYLEEIVTAPVKKTETNDRGGSVALTTQHPLSAKVGTTSPTSGGRSVGIVRSRTKATVFFTHIDFL